MQKLKSFASAIAIAALSGLPAQADDKEVVRLPGDAAPTSYDILIAPDIEAQTFLGEATLNFDVKKKTKRIVVNSLNLAIESATLDGATPARVVIDEKRQEAAFEFPKPLKTGAHKIDVKYSGMINDQAAGLFVSKFPTANGETSMLATQFEPGDARRLAPIWDEPEFKAVFNLSAILPEGMEAVSNSPVEAQSAAGEGKVRIDFAPSPKMSSYLQFFGAGDFDTIGLDAHGVRMNIVSRAGEAEKGRYALKATEEVVGYYNDYFGTPYPLPKLDEIALPGAGGFGAMENWGAILYFEPVLLLDPETGTPADRQRIYEVVAHEVAHQWFGDLVTMKWWDDLWLNEGFASWMGTKVTDKFNPDWKPWLQSSFGRDGAMSQDSLSSTHPIVQTVHNVEEATLAFDAITYQKGEAVIRMIEAFIGEESFRDGVRAYMKKHAYGNTVTGDLWRELETASDLPVTEIARDFTLQPGVPLIIVDDIACNAGGEQSQVKLRQSRFGADDQSKADLLTWRVPVTATIAGGGAVSRATISGPAAQSMTIEGCGAVKVNAGETGYFRTLYSDKAFADLADAYDSLGAADQLGLINDAYALGASGDASLTRFAALVEKTTPAAEPIALAAVVSDLSRLERYFEGGPDEAGYAEFARARLAPMLAALGWAPKAGEADNVTNLRNQIIGALVSFDDATAIAEVRKRYAAYQKTPASLHPAMVRSIVSTVARKADRKTFDEMLAKARNAKNPIEQRLYYFALTGVEDETLAQSAIAEFLDEKTPAQFRARLFAGLAGNHPRMIWDYYRKNFEAIDANLDALERIEYGPRIASASLEEEAADELGAFAAEHLPESAKSAVDGAVSRIRFAARIKRDRVPELAAWLRARS